MNAASLSFGSSLNRPEPLELSQGMLRLIGTRLSVEGRHHIPTRAPLIVISNHRSPLDAPALMAALECNVAFACHQYMANVPVLRDVVDQFGAFPLGTPRQFFYQACRRLRHRHAIGLFPEGAKPMVTVQPPRLMNPFQRGFAHLALRAPVSPLAVLPVALVSDDEGFESPIPLKLLGWFDPSEPLFQQTGGHPIVFYRKLTIKIGTPIWITPHDRRNYQGRQGSQQAQQLTEACWTAVHDLLHG
ncbi:MAG: 1-acyl-sn-glycerol-3-phosphate acyltransferase [Leptolyngbya sp. SIO1E4]|nr:1-acyl-sn-glycerol-3-phosphate acyltransferase [Leptolyngbya sp. SIO1E4]